MRNSELNTGIEVFDEKGEVVGTSKVAAKKVTQDVLMCMCSKGPNSLYSYGDVWNRKPYRTFALHNNHFPCWRTGGSHYRGHGLVSYECGLCCVQYTYVSPSIDLGAIAGFSESVRMHTFV